MRFFGSSSVSLILLAGSSCALAGCEETSVARASQPSTPRASAEQTPAAPQPTTPPPGAAAAAETSAASRKDPPEPDIVTDGPRVYAKSRHVWIRSEPTSAVQWIGFLWMGGSVRIRNAERVTGAGCSHEWVPIEPRGWVCVDGDRVTTDPDDEQLRTIWPYRPRVESPWPHQYAEVHAPLRRYEVLPDEETQSMREVGFERHMAMVRRAREAGSTEEFPDSLRKLDPSLANRPAPAFPLTESGLPDLPRGLSEGRTRMAGRSALAYSIEADHGDRAFLLAADLSWVPKDRVELLERSEFQGVELKGAVRLPLAFFRGKPRPGFRRHADGRFEEVPDQFERLSYVLLEKGEVVKEGHTRYYKVVGRDLWVNDRQAVVPTPKKTTPWGAPIGAPDQSGKARTGRATWLEASILGGWLVAFEGTRPVYATMISAGRGGKPHPEKDPLETASTPTGWFPIGGKFKTATMDSSTTPIVHGDVPWTQNFSGPHALHSAYWHDDWGSLKSAGCVNVSPRDGKWLFEFTEPSVPDGWHGVRHIARYGGSTLFIIHE